MVYVVFWIISDLLHFARGNWVIAEIEHLHNFSPLPPGQISVEAVLSICA